MLWSRTQAAWIVLSALSVSFCVGTLGFAEDADGPILKPGWNLIGVPVNPADPTVTSVFADALKVDKLLSVWAYDSADGWRKVEFANRHDAAGPPNEWNKPQQLPKAMGETNALKLIEAGKAYWVEVKQDAPGDGIPLRYNTRIAESKHLVYTKGWNLIAFDADTKQKFQREGTKDQSKSPKASARSSITAVFGLPGGENVRPTHVVRYDQIRRRLVSTSLDGNGDNKDPDAGEWLQRGTGYWCYFPKACPLEPSLVTTLDADVDFEPKLPAPFPGPEDFDANRDGQLDGPNDQNTMSVGYGANALELLVRNNGTGLLSFQVQPDGYWKANTSVFEPYPKVERALSPKQWTKLGDGAPPWLVEMSGAHGVTPRSLDDGILADVKDTSVRIKLDRTGLDPGHYLLRIQLNTTAGSKTLYLHVTVPPLVGDFEGKAVLTHVNGRRNEVGQVDFRLCITRDPNGTILGVIDSNATGIVPMDVPLVGHQIGSRIFLYGAYSLPGRTQTSLAVTGNLAMSEDGNRRQLNPFQKRLSRFITIEGIEASPGTFRGDIHDIFYGDVPFPVHASGLESNGAGIEISRSGVAQKANAWFPVPEKAPRGGHPLKGTIGNMRTGQNMDRPRLQVILTGMGRTGVAPAELDGTWKLPGVPPGIYSISVSGGSCRVIELKEMTVGETVTAAVIPADDTAGDPTELSYLGIPQPVSADPSLISATRINSDVPADLGKGKTRVKCDAFISQGMLFRPASQPGMRLSVSTTRTLTMKEKP